MQYFQYKALSEMEGKYIEYLNAIEEEEGVIPDEFLLEFLELDEQIEESIYRAWNTEKELKGVIKRRKEEIERLEAKNTSDEKRIEFFRTILTRLVKEKGQLTKNSTINLKISDLSFTIGKSKSVEIDDAFEDARVTTFKVDTKLDATTIEKIKLLNPNVEVSKSVDKVALKKLLETEVMPNARIIESDKITVR